MRFEISNLKCYGIWKYKETAMTYERFEDAPTWQAAIAMAHSVWTLSELPVFDGMGDRDQLRRWSLSVSNNIAEGFEQGTTGALLQLSTSPAVRRDTLRVDVRGPGGQRLKHFARELESAKKLAENVSRRLRVGELASEFRHRRPAAA